jgi:hypothetical protein
LDIFVRDSGKASVANGQMLIAADSNTTEASYIYNMDDYLPIYYEVTATFTANKPTGGAKANGYIIFDYQSDIDFKYAGINVSNNQIEMGYRDASGWHKLIQSNKPFHFNANTAYQVTLAVNGTNATVVVNGVNWFSYTYTPRLDENGQPIPLNKGSVGIGLDGGSAKVDNFAVQVLPPDITLEIDDDFQGPNAASAYRPQSGAWTVGGGVYNGLAQAGDRAVALADIGGQISASSILELQAKVAGGQGGLAFDYYGPNEFKFVTLDAANDKILIGHVSAKSGLVIDSTYNWVLSDTSANALKLQFGGAAISLMVNNAFVGSVGYNSALVDGRFGLVSMDNAASFDNIVIRTNDPAFATPQDELAGSVATGTGVTGVTIDRGDVRSLLDDGIAIWARTGLLDAAQMAKLGTVDVRVGDLGPGELARYSQSEIIVDRDAAGQGWFVDLTPLSNEEYRASANGELLAVAGSVAKDGFDLLSVLLHELGHAAGFSHANNLAALGGVMSETLDVGARRLPLQNEVSDADGVRYFDEETGLFGNQTMLSLMRFAGVSTAHLAAPGEFMAINGVQPPSVRAFDAIVATPIADGGRHGNGKEAADTDETGVTGIPPFEMSPPRDLSNDDGSAVGISSAGDASPRPSHKDANGTDSDDTGDNSATGDLNGMSDWEARKGLFSRLADLFKRSNTAQ